MSVFDERYNNDETGRLAYDPSMLLRVIMSAYARGITSSRLIERLCKENVVFIALSGDSQPHFTTVANFVSIMSDVIQPLFTDSDILKEIIVTADTGFANEANMTYLYENKINGYIPDNQFRFRDPKFQDRHAKHPQWKRQNRNPRNQIPASAFKFDPVNKTCQCPAGEDMWLKKMSPLTKLIIKF